MGLPSEVKLIINIAIAVAVTILYALNQNKPGLFGLLIFAIMNVTILNGIPILFRQVRDAYKEWKQALSARPIKSRVGSVTINNPVMKLKDAELKAQSSDVEKRSYFHEDKTETKEESSVTVGLR